MRDVDSARALDLPADVVPARGVLVDHPDRARYVEGQRIYVATCDPRRRADVIVDNTDLALPRLA